MSFSLRLVRSAEEGPIGHIGAKGASEEKSRGERTKTREDFLMIPIYHLSLFFDLLIVRHYCCGHEAAAFSSSMMLILKWKG